MRARVDVAVRPDRAELVSAHLLALGATGVWQHPDGLTAWFETLPDGIGGSDPTTNLPPELGAGSVRVHDDGDWERDWQAEWKATIEPVRAGRFAIVPTWLADSHVPTADELTLVLDPGRAFGSGHHATTTLCLELLDELDLAGALAGRAVADIGCGTGILAIAAAARGARTVAVDIDPDAVRVTGENAARNGVDVAVAVGSADAVEPSDVVVANLVTDTVVALAPALLAATTGVLIVSGIAAERQERALTALRAAGGDVEVVRERDGWIAAQLRATRR